MNVATRALPSVFLVCAAPLLYEALADSLKGLAVLNLLPAGYRDLAGLIRSVDADALVVDSSDDAAVLDPVAQDLNLPLLEVSLRERSVRVLRSGTWTEHARGGESPESIRNLLARELFARGGAR